MFFLGMIIGSLGWYLSDALYGVSEPYTSDLAFYSLELFLGLVTFLLAYKSSSIFRIIIFIMGVYSGQAIYSIADGGAGNMDMISAQLGEITKICIFPLIAGFIGLVTRKIINKKLYGKI